MFSKDGSAALIEWPNHRLAVLHCYREQGVIRQIFPIEHVCRVRRRNDRHGIACLEKSIKENASGRRVKIAFGFLQANQRDG